jgi:hypothetical protein
MPKKVGRKLNQKRSDFHYTAEDGSTWDSRFEYLVYKGAKDAGCDVRRCEKWVDTIPYSRILPRASCQDCGSNRVSEERGVTFDLFINNRDSAGKEDSYYLESKGYMRGPKRSLYRSLFKDKPDTCVRFVIQSNFKVGKGTFGGWINKHLGCPWAIWKGSWNDLVWIYPPPKKIKRERKKSKSTKESTK